MNTKSSGSFNTFTYDHICTYDNTYTYDHTHTYDHSCTYGHACTNDKTCTFDKKSMHDHTCTYDHIFIRIISGMIKIFRGHIVFIELIIIMFCCALCKS